ncbi:MAG: Ycf66 family protein [Microcoleaceae cyanobacterium]
MVNLGLNFSSLLGIILILSGVGLYFLRTWKPKLARDHDIFFAAIGLLCGFILLFQGWRLDPILAFGQFLLTGSAVFFAVESIRLRAVSTTKARERAPIVDDERYVSDVYRVDAELDELEPMDEYTPMARQIRGSRDSRPSRAELYYDEEEVSRRRPTAASRTSRSILDKPNPSERPRRRRSARPSQDDWEAPNLRDEREYASGGRNRRPVASQSWDAERWETDYPSEPKTSKPRRSRTAEEAAYRSNRIEPINEAPESSRSRKNSSDYTDYRPLEESDNRFDRPYDMG